MTEKNKAKLSKVSKEISEKIKSGKLKLKVAPQLEIKKYPKIQEKFLKIIGHPEALVTDESSLSDFGDLWLPGVRLETLRVFNVDIKPVMNKNFSDIFAYIDSKPKPKITLKALAEQLGLELVK